MSALARALVLALLDASPRRCRAVVEAARREGSVAVKLMQLAVSSGHISGELAARLREELLSRALPQPWEATREALEEARVPVDGEPSDVASGALAQVVVIGERAYKVTHAGAEESVERLRRALSSSWLPVPHGRELLRYLDGMSEQLDMRREEERLRAASASWGGDSQRLRLPSSFGATRRVLSMTALRAEPQGPRELSPGLAAVASYALWALHLSEGEVHGDLHEGNYGFVVEGGVAVAAVLYDFGLTIKVSPEQRACAAAMDVGDFRGAFEAMSARGASEGAARKFEARVRERIDKGEGMGEAMRRSWPVRGPVPFGDLNRCSFSTQVAALERAVGLEPVAAPGASAKLLRAVAALKRAALAEAAEGGERFARVRDQYLASIEGGAAEAAIEAALKLYPSVEGGLRRLRRKR